jgi:ABC-type uncharacterized transport system substrate-binding protein
MKRRDFMALLSGAAAWPLAARAERSAMPVVGFLNSASHAPFARNVTAFQQALNAAGYIEGQNVAIEYRWADGKVDRLPALAADLVQRKVAVIAAFDTASAFAAKVATKTIPVIFLVGGDPIKVGLVASLRRPSGNVTGVSILFNTLAAKQLEVLHEAIPKAHLIGLLTNSTNPNAKFDVRDVQAAANVLGHNLLVVKCSTETELESVFNALTQRLTGALVVTADPFFIIQREKIVELAARQALPAIYPMPDFVIAGGLMSYGTSLANGYREVGVYAGRVLKGAQAAVLPVQQAVKVELIINLKTAKALGITLPLALLGRADEVIE